MTTLASGGVVLLTALCGLVLWFYLPGWCWAPWLVQLRYPVPSVRIPRLFLEISASTAASAVTGLCLLEAGVFSLSSMALALTVICAAGCWASRHYLRPRYGSSDAALVAIGITALLWFSPPLPARLHSADATGYLSAGLLAARTGGLVVEDATTAHLPLDLRRVFFPSVAADRGSPPYLRLDGGFILRSLDEPEVLPAFHHGIVPWVAATALLLGEDKTEWLFTAFGALSSVALWGAAHSLGLTVGSAALVAVLNAIQVPYYFYGRFPMPEVPAAFYLWAGVALVAGHSGRLRVAALGGVAFGCASLLRLENVFFTTAAFVMVALVYGIRQNIWSVGLLAVALNLYAIQHAAAWRTHYWGNLGQFLATHRLVIGVALAFLAGMAPSLYLLRRSFGARFADKLFRIFLVALICALVLVSTQSPSAAGQWQLFAKYCAKAYLPLGFAAITYVVWADARPATLLAASLPLLGAGIFLLVPNAAPVDLWVVRRTTSHLLPGVALFTGLALSRVARGRSGRANRRLTAMGLLATICISAPKTAAFVNRPYYASARVHEAVLTESVVGPSVAVIHGSLAALGFAPLLWAKRDCPVYYFKDPHHWYFTALVESLRSAGRRIYLFLPSGSSQAAPPLTAGNWVPYLTYSFPVASPYFATDDHATLWKHEEVHMYIWQDRSPNS